MRSEHNGGASLAAFLLAVSTVTLLFVSPVEGQVGDACVVTAFPGEPEACPATDSQGNLLFCDTGTCEECCPSSGRFPTCQLSDCDRLFAGDGADQVANCQRECFDYYACATNADCPDALPYCNVPDGATEGECKSNCVVTAFPGEPGSCGGDELCNIAFDAGICRACPTSITLDDCQAEFASIPDTVRADQIAQCERSCFDYYACATNADCAGSLPFCTNGQCGACEVNAFPSATGSCPDIPEGQPDEGPQLCVRTATEAATPNCALCSGFAQNDGITSPAGCELFETNFNQNADVVANCQRGCFGFYACTTNADCQDVPGPLAQACTSGVCTDIDECGTNADCPVDRPLCDAGQCVVSSVPSSPTFSPLDGMGGGSSA